MDIDRSAPLQVRRQVKVDGPADMVWDLLADVDGWPRWNADVREAVAPDGVRPGAEFKWKAGPGRITSTFVAVDRPHELGWTGHTLGIKAVHVYRLTPNGDRTMVTLEESWSGLPARLMLRRSEKLLSAAVENGLERLQAEVARRQHDAP